MKLLVLDQFSELGGAQRCLLDLLPAIRARGWDALIGLPGSGELFARVRALGFDAEQISCGPFRSGSKSASDLVRFAVQTPRLAHEIRRLAARIGADLVYVNGPRLLPAAALAGLDLPVVFHAHSYLQAGLVRRLAGAGLRRMRARVIGQSRFVAEPWMPYVGTERVTIVYNGVAGPERVAERSADAAPRVGYIGRIAPEKGLIDFLSAAALIHKAVPECRFCIYGAAVISDPTYEGSVRAAAAGLPVQFAGWVDDVYAAMAGMDVLLVPSTKVEGTTRVILEAFAAGLPVIAFRAGGIPEVIEHGVNGLLVEGIEEMAKECVGLLRDPAKRAAISQAGRGAWDRRFTLERYQDVAHALWRALPMMQEHRQVPP
jgi:glycosyltransferase involved in cell wall biosynthesis